MLVRRWRLLYYPEQRRRASTGCRSRSMRSSRRSSTSCGAASSCLFCANGGGGASSSRIRSRRRPRADPGDRRRPLSNRRRPGRRHWPCPPLIHGNDQSPDLLRSNFTFGSPCWLKMRCDATLNASCCGPCPCTSRDAVRTLKLPCCADNSGKRIRPASCCWGQERPRESRRRRNRRRVHRRHRRRPSNCAWFRRCQSRSENRLHEII